MADSVCDPGSGRFEENKGSVSTGFDIRAPFGMVIVTASRTGGRMTLSILRKVTFSLTRVTLSAAGSEVVRQRRERVNAPHYEFVGSSGASCQVRDLASARVKQGGGKCFIGRFPGNAPHEQHDT